MYLELAKIGSTTTVLESVASSIAAGMTMGGFFASIAGLALGWRREEVEARLVRDAGLGGLGAIGLLLVDLITGHLP